MSRLRNCVIGAIALASSSLFAQTPPLPIGPGGGSGGGGGGGSGTVTSIATGCQATGGTITTTGTIATDLVTGATITSSQQDNAGWCGQQIIGNAATAQTLTLENTTTNNYFRFINKGAGTWTLSAGTGSINSGCTSIAQNQSADIQSDGTNWNIACGVGGGTGANPTATAGPNAVNGSASTFMRSDAAPAVQVGSASQEGIVQVDNTTISASAGTITAKNTAVNTATCTPGSSCTVNAMPHPGYVSGNWYVPGLSIGPTTGGTKVASTVYCSPWPVGSPGMTIKTLGVSVSATSNGNNISMAVYANDGTHFRPGALVDSVGTTGIPLTASTGTYSHAVANTTDVLSPGIYWACYSPDNATVVVTAIGTGGALYLVGSSNSTTVLPNGSSVNGVTCTAGSTCQGASFAWSGTTFAWPASLSTSTWADNTGSAPLIGFQAN